MKGDRRTMYFDIKSPNLIIEIMKAFFASIDFILLIRLLFKLIGADASVKIINIIYGITEILIKPFSGLVGVVSIDGPRTGMIFEPSVIMAIIVFGFIAWIVMSLTKPMILKRMQAME